MKFLLGSKPNTAKGNNGYALVSGSYNNSGQYGVTRKYEFPTDVVTQGSGIAATALGCSMSGPSNVVIKVGVATGASTQKYATATDAVTNGTAIYSSAMLAASSNSSTGFAFGGQAGTGATNAVYSYGFANDLVGYYAALAAARRGLAGSGNTTDAYAYCGGTSGATASATGTVQKLNYASFVSTAFTNVTAAFYTAGFGNTTVGYNAGGQLGSTASTAITNRLTYANDTFAAGNSLSVPRAMLGATASGTTGLICAGSNLSSATDYTFVDKRNLVTDANSSGTSLPVAITGVSCGASEPGWF